LLEVDLAIFYWIENFNRSQLNAFLELWVLFAIIMMELWKWQSSTDSLQLLFARPVPA